MKSNKTVAAIDLGTNSCKMAIVAPDGRFLYRNAIAVRMGEGLAQRNCFSEEVINRGIECFCTFKRIMDEKNVNNYRAIATAACRAAENGNDFVKKIKQQTNVDLEVISPFEEALLSLKGALLNVENEKTDYVVVYDLGGGSTEITLATRGKEPKILHTVSIPWGGRNAAEAFGLREFDSEKAAKLAEEIKKYTSSFVKESGLEKYKGNVCFIATSGTALRLAHIANGWRDYDRERADGAKIATSKIDEAIENIRKLSHAQMSVDKCIGPARADIFNAASVIFSQIYKDLGAEELVTSLKSAIDGMIMELQNG